MLRSVVTVLSLLYGKVDAMYASALVRRQIDESGLVAQVSKLRVSLGIGAPLAASAT